MSWRATGSPPTPVEERHRLGKICVEVKMAASTRASPHT
jgi:hypothetical protein